MKANLSRVSHVEYLDKEFTDDLNTVTMDGNRIHKISRENKFQ